MTSWTRLILLPLLLNSSIHWRERSDLPDPRAGYIAGEYQGKLLIAGGSHWENDRKVYSDRADVFDIQENRWLPIPALPEARSDAACATFQGSVYAFGGVVDGKMTGSVIRLSERGWSGVAKLDAASMYGMAVATETGVLLLGGLSTMGDLSSATRELRLFQPNETWKRLAEFPGLSRVTAATAWLNGKLYVFGGVHMPKPGAAIANLDDVWAYDLATDRWSRESTLPVARRAWGAAAVNGNILLLGGYTNDFSNEIYSYDPKARTTTPAGVLPHALADAKYIRIGNGLFTAGGESGIKIRSRWTIQGTWEKGR